MDIEEFLRSKAVEFIDRRWCAVYLIVEEAAFDIGIINILAYFTLSHKSLIPEFASSSAVKKAGGFSGMKSIHFVLIGQLGKFIGVDDEGKEYAAPISGKEIIKMALEIIRASDALIPCRCVLVECSDEEKVQKVYIDNHFTAFQKDGKLNQFYRRITPFPDEEES